MTVLTESRTPNWFWIAAAFGLAWNVFGVVQFIGSLGQTVDGLMMGGMTAEQARVYHALPVWATIAFAVGTVGGTIGCIALLMRRSVAVSIFATSLVAYCALYAADYAYGVFAALPSQMAILTFVVAVAIALLIVASKARGRGFIR